MTDDSEEKKGGLLHAEITRRILVTFFKVYNELGTGFLESIFRDGLARALIADRLAVDSEVPVDVMFRDEVLGRFRADLVVEGRIIVEVKAVRVIQPEHRAQLIHYLRATALEVGLLVNFGPSPEFQRYIYSNSRKRGSHSR